MKSAILLGALAAVAVSLVPQATAREHVAKTARTVFRPDPAAMRRVLAGIAHHRDETWRWQRVMHVHRTPYSTSVQTARSLAYRKWVLQLWQQRADRWSGRVIGSVLVASIIAMMRGLEPLVCGP